MNKLKFEAYLRKKLTVLHEREIDEIVSEYLHHIDMRTADGASEEQAIKDFGNLNVLVDEILDAYKIDPDHNKFEDFSKTFKRWFNLILDYINKISNSIMSRTGREIVNLIVEFVLVIVLLIVISVVLDIVFNNFMRLFYGFIVTTRIVSLIIRLFKNLLNITITLTILYWFANERILKYKSSDFKSQLDQKANEKGNAKTTSESKAVKNPIFEESVKLDDNDLKTVKQANILREKEVLQSYTKERSFGQLLFDGNLFIIRAVMFIILIPLIVVGVFLGIAFITIVYNTIIGSGSLGLSIILSGVLLIYFYLLILMINFVSGGK